MEEELKMTRTFFDKANAEKFVKDLSKQGITSTLWMQADTLNKGCRTYSVKWSNK
jgi:hypothetical protein